MPDELTLLHRLARAYGLQTMHRDGFARPVVPAPETVLAVLRTLGAPVERISDAAGALRERRLCLWRAALEPVQIAWDCAPLKINLRIPGDSTEGRVRYSIALEGGATLAGECDEDRCTQRIIDGSRFVERRLRICAALPHGYHRLYLTAGTETFSALLLSAPQHSYDTLGALKEPWGLFCPTYALAGPSNWGAGDFGSLESFAGFATKAGARVIGTLPLLASFLDEPFDPSPYAAVSRLFWNEFYLNVERIPDFEHCPAAHALVDAPEFRAELEDLRAASLVDYRRIMALKRRVLEELLASMLKRDDQRRSAFETFVASSPTLQRYALFRAAVERERKPWQQWKTVTDESGLPSSEDPAARYHAFVQWLAVEQMDAVKKKTQDCGVALYLDFPLGVHRDGFDVWQNQNLFALSASAGAPPDELFVGGQNWGFPPLLPEAIRRQDYRYYIDCLRHHLRHADLLRIDHVMGLHRMYWIPQDCAATDGVYVHYKANEFYAILSIESHRQRGQIVGENLGTVPEYANSALCRHRIFGLNVGQFGVDAASDTTLKEIPPGNVASLNTHDTATFAGFWNGSDIEDRLELGLVDSTQTAQDHARRAAQRNALSEFLRARGQLDGEIDDPAAVLKAWLCFVAENKADLLLINLEDLWLERLPQNVPGTWHERPNWRRKARYSLDELRDLSTELDILAAVNQARSQTEQSRDG